MIVTTLAFLLSVLILAKMILVIFYPQVLGKMLKPFVDLIKANYLNTQIIALSTLLIVGAIMVSLIGFLNLIAAGWFWTIVYSISFIPAYRHITPLAPIKKLFTQADFKTDMQLVYGVYIALSVLTILYVISFWI